MESLPALFLPLRIGAPDGQANKKQKTRLTPTPTAANEYAEAARRVLLPSETMIAANRYEIWSRPALPAEAEANARLRRAFAAPQGSQSAAAPTVDDLVRVAEEIGATALDEKAQRRLQETVLEKFLPAERNYIAGVTLRGGGGRLASRIDFHLQPRWKGAFALGLEGVPSFDAYTKMNSAVKTQMETAALKEKIQEPVTSTERVMVVLPGATDQEKHTDGADLPMCTLALNLRQTEPRSGCTEFPVAQAAGAFPAPNVIVTTGLVDESALESGPASVHKVNDATGAVSAWSGKALHRGTANASKEARVFLYTEWALGDHNA